MSGQQGGGLGNRSVIETQHERYGYSYSYVLCMYMCKSGISEVVRDSARFTPKVGYFQPAFTQ